MPVMAFPVKQEIMHDRILGERIRAAYHRLPFKAIPKLMNFGVPSIDGKSSSIRTGGMRRLWWKCLANN